MAQATGLTKTNASVPGELDSDGGKLVYMYLEVHRNADISQISEDLALGITTLCPLLETLEARGYITREGDEFTIVD